MSQPLNHLTIYDERLSDEHKNRFSCLRFFYYILLILNIATIASGVVGSVFGFMVIILIQVSFMIIWMISIVFYVNYPTSSFTRWLPTQIYLMLYSVWTLISIILFPVLMFFYKDRVEERLDRDHQNVSISFGTIISIVFILLSFPVMLSFIVGSFYFKRRNIASEMNSKMDHSINTSNRPLRFQCKYRLLLTLCFRQV